MLTETVKLPIPDCLDTKSECATQLVVFDHQWYLPVSVYSSIALADHHRSWLVDFYTKEVDGAKPAYDVFEDTLFVFRHPSRRVSSIGVISLDEFEQHERTKLWDMIDAVYNVTRRLADVRGRELRHEIANKLASIKLAETIVNRLDRESKTEILSECVQFAGDIDELLFQELNGRLTPVNLSGILSNIYNIASIGRYDIDILNGTQENYKRSDDTSIDERLLVPEAIRRSCIELGLDSLKYGGELSRKREFRLYLEACPGVNRPTIVFQVSNYGPPIPVNEIERVIEYGYRGSNANGVAEGGGQGLSDVVNRLGEGHYLDIIVQNKDVGYVGRRIIRIRPYGEEPRIEIHEINNAEMLVTLEGASTTMRLGVPEREIVDYTKMINGEFDP